MSRKKLTQDERFARVLAKVGDDPASLLMVISVMERIIHTRGKRTRRAA